MTDQTPETQRDWRWNGITGDAPWLYIDGEEVGPATDDDLNTLEQRLRDAEQRAAELEADLQVEQSVRQQSDDWLGYWRERAAVLEQALEKLVELQYGPHLAPHYYPDGWQAAMDEARAVLNHGAEPGVHVEHEQG